MSEPNSLFARIHISPEKFEVFLRAAPKIPSLDHEWLAWWDGKEMYKKSHLQEKSMRAYSVSHNEAVISTWRGEKDTATFSDYDAANSLWHFGIIFFSENYLEMIPGIAFIKSVEDFKDAHEEDFALIYNYFWEDDSVAAYLRYPNNKSILIAQAQKKADIPTEILDYTETYLNQKYEYFRKKYSD